MNETEIGDLIVFVKMEASLQKMKTIEDENYDTMVVIKPNRNGMKDHDQIWIDGFCF